MARNYGPAYVGRSTQVANQAITWDDTALNCICWDDAGLIAILWV